MLNPEAPKFLLRQDPIGFGGGNTNFYGYVDSVGKGSNNAYQYAFNNPVRFSDPLGLWAVQVGAGGSGLFPALGGSAQSGFAVSFSWVKGLQFAGFQSGEGRLGLGAFGGYGLTFTFTPCAKEVSDLGGKSVGLGFDTWLFGASGAYSGKTFTNRSYSFSVGPGVFADVYGSAAYTHVGPAVTLFGGTP